MGKLLALVGCSGLGLHLVVALILAVLPDRAGIAAPISRLCRAVDCVASQPREVVGCVVDSLLEREPRDPARGGDGADVPVRPPAD